MIHFEESALASGKKLAIATLDAEKSLNSLSLDMIKNLYAQLQTWKKDSAILAVLIRGKGRAFCAGGDIRALYQSMLDKSQYVFDFFEHEYRLDNSLYTYPKPLIVWAHGITMGGGMGVMQGARYRIVTESTKMAMPEITIGLIPDVGSSFFLRKVPKNWGLFLELSGVQFKGADATQLYLADYKMADAEQENLLAYLQKSKASTSEALDLEIKNFFELNQVKDCGNEIFSHELFIEALLKNKDAVSLIKWAQTYAPNAKDEWEKRLLANIQKACPTSLALIYEIWERHKNHEREKCFYDEWFVASQCGIHGNFQEGVRALLIDKDNAPKWKPATVNELTKAAMESHFHSPLASGKNPLEDLLV